MHAITIPYDMIHGTGALEGQRVERMLDTITFFTAINNTYYSHTDWYIITIVQTSKLATWQKRLLYMYSPAILLVRHIVN